MSIQFVFLWLFFDRRLFTNCFSPDTTDYDTYGSKIALNDKIFVQANGEGETFLVQFSPYNYTLDSLQCSFDYDDSSHYIYSVGVGQKQNTSLNVYFYVIGEVTSDEDESGRNGSFIGVWINQDPHSIDYYLMTREFLSCHDFVNKNFQFLTSYDHQEFFVMAVEPYGRYAIGLATDFALIYTPFPSATIRTLSSAQIWPNNATFYPLSADASDTFTIVAGFVAGTARSRVRATPTIYLLSNTDLKVLSTWSYSATNSSWQSRLTYSGVDVWNSKYTISVKINSDDPAKVLVGMPFLNTVFFFTVTNNSNLTLASYLDDGESVGYGKSVTWLTNSQAVILVSSYSFDYLTWYSTKVYVYTSLSNTTLPSSPTVVIPNTQQPIPSTINSKLIRLASSPSSLAILDNDGGVLMIIPEDAGYYASTDTTDSPIAASMPVISHSSSCIAGTYKSDVGIHACQPCASGTRNPGVTSAKSCMNCSSDSFCPLGAAYELNSSFLIPISQAYAYPRSPDTTSFEDILLQNMFSFGTTPSCLLVSPIFWTLILIVLFLILFLVMASLNCCVQPPKRELYRAAIKHIFRSTDLVGEGEWWVGGLASIAVVLVSAMAYTFAISYMYQYPIETTDGSKFACDSTLRNAKFESSLQPLAVPPSTQVQPMFDMLDTQNFTLQFDLLNTVLSCMRITFYKLTDSSTISLSPLSCSQLNGTVSTTILLPDQQITIRVVFDDIQLIGGIRVGLSGSGQNNGFFTLKQLNFLQPIYSPSKLALGQSATIKISMTKVINETDPLFDSDPVQFSGIWYPTFTYSYSEMFMTAAQYATTINGTSTDITIATSETSYYIKNIQSPIAKQPEVIFRTLLFAFLCLELCAMAFILCKLLIIPLINRITSKCCGQLLNTVEPMKLIVPQHHHH
ncbi:unnamed protein product [Adineta ricciae]|uniref:Tyrosine-protein kinase ephrin type A/B receptor-like domain-containing protein n=1 Tax=Adineta ricciae TaxID=249248 RepID=A0A813MDH0_ADIRI|nr:unnamed protein product [Adineta ricciae]CAF0819316.1 unnamed protein product [Adineta ricciae]